METSNDQRETQEPQSSSPLAGIGASQEQVDAAVSYTDAVYNDQIDWGGKVRRYSDYEASGGKEQRASWQRVDRNLPIGSGEGTRPATDDDIIAGRLYSIDQSLAKRDEAYSPTFDSTDAQYWSSEYLNFALDQVQQGDPELVSQLLVSERAMALFPEIAVVTRNGFQFSGITSQMAWEALGTTDLAQVADKHVETTDFTTQFWNKYGDFLDPKAKEAMMTAIAPLTPKEQEHVTALVAGYIDSNPPQTEQDQIEMMSWVYRKAEEIYAKESDKSFWGKFGRVGAWVFTKPANYIQDELIGNAWSAASDPADAWYRKELTLEETMALSFGQDVGTVGWDTFTGLAGVGIDVIIDPTNIALLGLGGYKLAKTAAMIDDIADLSLGARTAKKAALVVREMIPFAGGKKAAIAVGLPQGLRGRTARIAWTIFGKSQDRLIATAAEKGVFKEIAGVKTIQEAIERVPQLKNVKSPFLLEYIVGHDTEEGVRAAYTAAIKGDFLDDTSTAFKGLEEAAVEADGRVATHINTYRKDLTAGDIVATQGGGAYHPIPIEIEPVTKITEDSSIIARGIEGTDETTREGALASARGLVKKLSLTPSEEISLADGSKVGVIRLGQDGVIAVDKDGKVIGSLIGESLGVTTEAEGNGLGSTLIKMASEDRGISVKELVDQSATVSEAGAAAARKATRATSTSAGNTARVATAETKKVYFLRKGSANLERMRPGSREFEKAVDWIRNNTRFKNDGLTAGGLIRKDALKAYMKANSIDVIEMDGTIIFQDSKKLMQGNRMNVFKGGVAQDVELDNLYQESKLHHARVDVNAPKVDKVGKWIVSDMPRNTRTVIDDLFVWRSHFGVFGGKSYDESSFLVRKARGLVAKMFVDDVPVKIETGLSNRAVGSENLRRLLVQMGVDPEFVKRSLNVYHDSPTRETVMNIIQGAARDIGDPELELNLWRFNEKAGNSLEYARVGGDVGFTMGRDASGVERLQPLMSSHLSQAVDLPESRALSAHLRRIKRAKSLPATITRGFGRTKARRADLLEKFERALKGNKKALKQFRELDESDRLAMAYATVRPRGSSLPDGLGYAAQFGQVAGEWNNRLRNVFSVAMLAWRPMGWMGNEMIDNSWRAMIAGGLSFFSHPFASAQGAMDTHRINSGLKVRAAYLDEVNSLVSGMRGLEDPQDVLMMAEGLVPNIRELLGAKKVKGVTSTTEMRNIIRTFLSDEAVLLNNKIEVLDKPLARMLYRQQRGLESAARYDLPVGSVGRMQAPEWNEVSSTGWEHQIARSTNAASTVHEYRVGQFTDPGLLDSYTYALQSVLAHDTRSYEVKLMFEQMIHLADGGEASGYAASRFVNTRNYESMREPITKMMRVAGLEPDTFSDLEKAEWYFNYKIRPYVEDTFGDILTPENMRTLFDGKGIVKIGGESIEFDIDDVDSIRDIVHAANGTDFRLPEQVVGVMNPRNAFGLKKANGRKTLLASYNEWALNQFGHNIPVNLQRRPAYVRAYSRYKAQAEAAGLTAEGADIVAHQKAIQQINTSFFYLEAQTPFLKSMNRVVPFFAAQWEVVRAWLWNVPTINNYAGIGHAQMLRTFDHIFNAFRRNGLIQPKYGKDGKVESWSLQFAENPHTTNIAGRAISKGAWYGLMAPSILVEQIAEIATAADLDLTADEINFNFNHPYDFFAKRGGVMPTARMQMGLNPLYAVPASWLNDQLGVSTTTEDISTDEEVSLSEFIDAHNADPRGFLELNGDRLVDAGIVTEDELRRLKGGTMGLSNITLPAGQTYYMPGQTIAGQVIKNAVFPYGQTDSIADAVSNYVPQALQNFFKTFALYQNDGEIDGLSAWISPWVTGPTGRFGLGVAYTDAAATLEMRTGLISRRGEIADQIFQAKQDGKDTSELETELHRIDDTITTEVRDIATSRAFLSTLYSVIMPFNPKRPTESQTLREYYYGTKSAAAQWVKDNPVLANYGDHSAEETLSLIAAWAADETGSRAKQEFLKQGGGQSSILAAITPKSYWGDGGIPSEIQSIDQYFELLKGGKVEALPLDVWQYRFRSLAIGVEREMVLNETYGNDPYSQAQAILQDKARYDAITEDFDEKWRSLELEDELVNDNAYMEWYEGTHHSYTATDFFMNEEKDRIKAVNEVLDLLDMDQYSDDPVKAKETANALKGVKANLFAVVEAYDDERYADWGTSPRQEIFNQYYEELGNYYDTLSNMYDRVAEAGTGEQRSMIYDEISDFRNTAGSESIRIDGVGFASPETYSWGSKSEDTKKLVVQSKLDDKVEWFTRNDLTHITSIYPSLAPFLPISPQAQEIIQWKKYVDHQIARDYGPGGIYEGKDSRKVKDRYEEEFKTKMAAAGEHGTLEFMDSYPIEIASKAQAIPPAMEWMVPQSVAIHRQLDSLDKSPGTNDAKVLQARMYDKVVQYFQQDPGSLDDFLDWGNRVLGAGTIEEIVAKMLGNYTGKIWKD